MWVLTTGSALCGRFALSPSSLLRRLCYTQSLPCHGWTWDSCAPWGVRVCPPEHCDFTVSAAFYRAVSRFDGRWALPRDFGAAMANLPPPDPTPGPVLWVHSRWTRLSYSGVGEVSRVT